MTSDGDHPDGVRAAVEEARELLDEAGEFIDQIHDLRTFQAMNRLYLVLEQYNQILTELVERR